MKKSIKTGIAALAAVASIGTLAACDGQDEATVVSENLSTAANNFEVARKILFINNFTGDYIQTIEGFCNIVAEPSQLEVTCKDPEGGYLKHFLGLNSTTTYSVEQLNSNNVSKDHYKVVVNPSTFIPDVDIK